MQLKDVKRLKARVNRGGLLSAPPKEEPRAGSVTPGRAASKAGLWRARVETAVQVVQNAWRCHLARGRAAQMARKREEVKVAVQAGKQRKKALLGESDAKLGTP